MLSLMQGLFASSITLALYGWPACFGSAVLFGAPFASFATLGWSATATAAFALPFALHGPATLDAILDLAAHPSQWVCRPVLLPGLMFMLGSWLGAVVIPLDWGEAWQPWPISSVYGGCVGLAVAAAVLLTVSAVKVCKALR